jgi:hypothetical protein
VNERDLAARLWAVLGGRAEQLAHLEFSGPAGGLASRFEVSALAAATIGVATLAICELFSHRAARPMPKARVDRRAAAAAFRGEHYLAPQGWNHAALWDPIAGDYRAADGWIRLHTNYPYHRAAALRALQCGEDRESVAEAVKGWKAEALEAAVVAEGGCAAALRTIDAWAAHPQGRALATEPLVSWEGEGGGMKARAPGDAPLSGLRVLDLTRVIAGPVGTRHLAAFGADVLRIDPPGFAEVPVLLPETTRGKRCAALDLKSPEGRMSFERLLKDTDVLVHGYRPGAMEALGIDLCGVVQVRYDAYGWSGPWAGRRGFDSLVQMSCGIAHPKNEDKPSPLPAQALDYGTGYLVAAAACRALVDGRRQARLALARTAKLLVDLGEGGDPAAPRLGDVADLLETSETEFGPVKQVRCPATIDGHTVRWPHRAGPLGRHPARWG